MPWLKDTLTVLALVISLSTFLYTILRNKSSDQAATLQRLGTVERQISVLEAKIDVFWKTVSIDAAKILHSPHPQHARRDELIEHFLADTLTWEELAEFAQTLRAAINDEHGLPGERMAASLLLRALEIRYGTLMYHTPPPPDGA